VHLREDEATRRWRRIPQCGSGWAGVSITLPLLRSVWRGCKGRKKESSGLGVVDGTTYPVLKAVIVLRNAGRDLVTITDLQTSCGCARALPGAAGTLPPPVTLAAGEETSVQGTVRLQDLDGPTTKLVWIYSRGSGLPTLTLEIAATVLHGPVSGFIPAFRGTPAGGSSKGCSATP
jgi:hypothetical protein